MDDAATSRPPHGSVLHHLRTLAPSLAPAERRVARAILARPEVAVEKTITELAQECRTSETTVVRFCRRTGFKGYPELRLTLATELGGTHARRRDAVAPGTDISRDDTLEQLVRKITSADVRAIEDTVDQLDFDHLALVIEAVADARRIGLFGLGASAFAAQDLQHKLLRIDRMALAISDPHLALASAALLRSGDVALGLSHTGETVEVIDCLRTAREHGATTVAITSYPHAPLTAYADLVLTTAVTETRFRSGAMASRIAQLAVVDCIFLGIAQRSFDTTVAALTTTHEAVHLEVPMDDGQDRRPSAQDR
ncbi:MAG TPA: MurR/RpiR family transcriptional regulator [Actinopolymorphaceae bacterium]